MSQESTTFATAIMKIGAVVQMVRILACHARGREFEPRPHRRGVFHRWKTPCFLRTTLTCGPSGSGFSCAALRKRQSRNEPRPHR